MDSRMPRLKRIINVILILVVCVAADQATKSLAKTYLPRDEVLTFAGDTFRLHYAENSGAFLSLGDSLPQQWRTLLFTIGMGIVVLVVLVYLFTAASLPPLNTLALALIGSGGLGNLIDRIIHGGYVVDFLNVGVGAVRTGIFNVADMAITSGVILLFFTGMRSDDQVDANDL
jgi:signal peptidase II